ncbi:FAD-dependent oxidoreductase [Streptomyces sp. NPDC004609]|uniref:FAD-dependent oxidoreductase n=1 Tax=Streptomyces sp. NPDC004609 TaxID=3364704 RepID=UPI00368987BE
MSEPLVLPRTGSRRRAVIVGGGFAGMLAAAACRAFAHEVIVVERDVLPDGPLPRRGLPQARHAHMLWSGGADAMEALVPGVTGRLLDAGAHRVPLPTGMVSLSPGGWYRRWPESHYALACGRDLLDWAVRDLVLRDDRVRVVSGTEALGLTGGPRRVDGVRIRTATGSVRRIGADLVVDASGRSSRGPRWLTGLGAGPVRELTVDAGVVYASRLYRAPENSGECPVFTIQADPRRPGPGQVATIVPIEGGRWLVSLSGTRGGRPTDDESAFVDFARGVRHPLVGLLLAHAEPLSGIAVTRSTANRRRLYERGGRVPEGFLAIGDAVAALNPVYGHGLSVAARSALALRGELRRSGMTAPGLGRRVRRAIARPTGVAWGLATGQDVFYPGSRGRSPGAADRLVSRWVNRLVETSTGSYTMARALTDVMTLQSGFGRLIRPDVLVGAVRGPLRPPLPGPPLTARERGFLEPGGTGTRDGHADGGPDQG